MNIKSRLDNKVINIELSSNKNYGIMLSGGLDSSVLFYLILKTAETQKINLSIQPFTIPKYDGSIKYIDNILLFLRNTFNISIPNTIQVGDPDVYHGNQSLVALKEIFFKYPNIHHVFLGTNQNPPDQFKLPGLYPNRVKSVNSTRVILPFIDLYKTHIVDLIYYLEATELINISHSCTEQQIGRCEQCFQCHERKWAFSQLLKEDTGKL
jgi:7-cyano-7-deazaguanine synthase in queuosine biosynthesis